MRARVTSLQTRLALLVTSLCVLLSLGMGAGVWRTMERASFEALDRELSITADALSQLIHLERDGSIDVEDHGQRELGLPLRVVDSRGRVLREGGLDWTRLDGQPGTRAVIIDGHPWRVLTRPLHLEHKGREATVSLQVATSARPMVELRAEVGRSVFLAALMTAVIGGLGALLVARATTGPLRTLSRQVETLDAPSLGSELPPLGRDREVLALTAAFNGMLRRLHAAFERQRAFVARASHALRTPAATILTRAEVTLARPRTGDEYREALEEIASAARESAALVQHLLSLARLEERSTELRLETVELPELGGEVGRLLAPAAHAAGVRLELQIPAGASIRADRAALRELLQTLLDNAVRYTPRGGAAGLRVEDGALIVWDTGPGMSAADKKQAFERFFRGSAAETTGAPGSGLGLVIAQGVAARHGGTIELEDRGGGGLEVIVRLPPGTVLATPVARPG